MGNSAKLWATFLATRGLRSWREVNLRRALVLGLSHATGPTKKHTARRQPPQPPPPSLLSTSLDQLHLPLFDDCIFLVFVFALHCLDCDFRRDAQSPTTEHRNLREQQVLHLASHNPISLAEFGPFRRVFRDFLVVIFVLRCLGGASSTPASAPKNDKINRRRDSKLNPPSHFPASLMSSTGMRSVLVATRESYSR